MVVIVLIHLSGFKKDYIKKIFYSVSQLYKRIV